MTSTPLGSAVEPEVYWRKAIDSGSGSGASPSTASSSSSSPSVAIHRTAASSGASAARPPSPASTEEVVSAARGSASRAMERRRACERSCGRGG